MKLKERYEKWLFNRTLANARKQFEKIRSSSVYNEKSLKVRRRYIKEILWAVGFKGIRIKEK